MLLDSKTLDAIAHDDKQLDNRLSHGIFLQEIGKNISAQDIIDAFKKNRSFNSGRIDWIKFIGINEFEAEKLLPLYHSDFFKTKSLAFQSTKTRVIETLMDKPLKNVTRLYLECLDPHSVRAAMNRLDRFNIEDLHLKFVSFECLEEVAYALQHQKTQITKIFYTREKNHSREMMTFNVDEFLNYVIPKRHPSDKKDSYSSHNGSNSHEYYGDLPPLHDHSPARHGGRKHSLNDESASDSNKVRRTTGANDVAEARQIQEPQQQNPLPPFVPMPEIKPLSLEDQHAISMQYLSNIFDERKSFFAAKQQWDMERAALYEHEKQLQSELANAGAQLNQLRAELDAYKRSKQQTQALIAELAQTEGFLLPQGHFAGTAPTLFAGNASPPSTPVPMEIQIQQGYRQPPGR